MLEMRDESFLCSNRGVGGKVDVPESERSFYGKWTVLQKSDGLLTKSGRSHRKWTVLLKENGLQY